MRGAGILLIDSEQKKFASLPFETNSPHDRISIITMTEPRYPNIPDVRDGLTEVERTILFVLHEARKEYGDRMIPAALIYGRVVERLDMSWEEFQRALVRVS
jgi:hypothetical protein